MNSESWFASCPRGIESLLRGELESLGAAAARETVAGCYFRGPLAVAYRVCLWSRLANRVLLSLAELAVETEDNRLGVLADIAWEDYLPVGASFQIEFAGTTRAVRNTRYGAQLTRDAIADRFRARGLARPQGARKSGDIKFRLRLHRGKLAVSLDFAGGSLHQRGYRREAGVAPLKENLAAALLLRADWPGVAARGGALIDPMCGSGTLLIEAALMAADIAPGLWRRGWGFERQQWHNDAQWRAVFADAQGRAERGRERQLMEIRGYDQDRRAVHQAGANIERAGLERQVRVLCKPLGELKKPTHRRLDKGLIICNPPYGARLGEREQLPQLYAELGRALLAEFPGWQAAVFTADKALGKATGIRSRKQYTLYNGAIAGTLLLFDLIADNRMEPVLKAPSQADTAESGPGAEMFANRIRKNLRRLERWARRQDISCYRIYDADMPEYAVVIDRYEDAYHVAEYRAPAGVEPAAAARRLGEVQRVLPEVLGTTAIHYRQRLRQKGRDQYQRRASGGKLKEVREGRARFLVNLDDYLDTGLFLDHRLLRQRIAAEAAGTKFLNLFAYTASASVHAALAGAASTTSVDMSRTYIDRAAQNFALNRLPTNASQHQLIQADCLEWLRQAAGSYDLIMLDPPSFSNSKRMQASFDVQRDHPALVRAALAMLAAGGVLYFSNNLRSFKIDQSLLAEFSAEDISAATIDVDFAKKPGIHRCWKISLRPEGL